MSSMIKMNNAHDEKISFCAASGSRVSMSAVYSLSRCRESTHHHLLGLPHHRSAVLYEMKCQRKWNVL